MIHVHVVTAYPVRTSHSMSSTAVREGLSRVSCTRQQTHA